MMSVFNFVSVITIIDCWSSRSDNEHDSESINCCCLAKVSKLFERTTTSTYYKNGILDGEVEDFDKDEANRDGD